MTSAVSQDEEAVSDVLGKAYDMYALTDFDDAIKSANALLDRTDLAPRDSIAIYEFLGVCNYAKGTEHHNKAFDYLNRIAGVGPCLNPLPQHFWPRQLCNKWYSLMKSKEVLNCSADDSGAKTIAFLPFDNYSVGEYQEKLGLLSHALAEFFAHDFGKVSSLQVIERNKLDYLLDEIKLSQEGITSETAAVKVGKMLGAQLMVFGTISQIDDRHARMVAKVVKVETSEIVASVDREGKPDFNSMQKQLVEDLAGKLDEELSDDSKSELKYGGSDSFDALYHYSLGLEYMDIYDYKNAYENFKKAYDMDKDFIQAKQKMDIYRPLVG
jgi:TolB-like protein